MVLCWLYSPSVFTHRNTCEMLKKTSVFEVMMQTRWWSIFERKETFKHLIKSKDHLRTNLPKCFLLTKKMKKNCVSQAELSQMFTHLTVGNLKLVGCLFDLNCESAVDTFATKGTSYWTIGNKIFLEKFLEDISPFCVAIDTCVLDFFWRLPWVSYLCVIDSSDSLWSATPASISAQGWSIHMQAGLGWGRGPVGLSCCCQAFLPTLPSGPTFGL